MNILESSTPSVGERRDDQFRSMFVSLLAMLVENRAYYCRNIWSNSDIAVRSSDPDFLSRATVWRADSREVKNLAFCGGSTKEFSMSAWSPGLFPKDCLDCFPGNWCGGCPGWQIKSLSGRETVPILVPGIKCIGKSSSTVSLHYWLASLGENDMLNELLPYIQLHLSVTCG